MEGTRQANVQPMRRDGAARDRLLDALTNFSTNRIRATSAIQALRARDPREAARATLQLLVETDEKTSTWKDLCALVMTCGLLADLLLQPQILSSKQAIALAQKVGNTDARVSVYLARHVIANYGGIASVPSADALRLLEVLDAISDCMALAPYLIQFQRHSCGRVRSKAALLLGRANWNLNRVENLMGAGDDRTRANVVESLWGHTHDQVRKILWEATRDRCRRVAINALVGLCKAGDRAARPRVTELARSDDPITRSAAAWAMGEIADSEFKQVLETLEQDVEPRVADMARKSLHKLEKLSPEPAAVPQQLVPAEQSAPTQASQKLSFVRIA